MKRYRVYVSGYTLVCARDEYDAKMKAMMQMKQKNLVKMMKNINHVENFTGMKIKIEQKDG